MTLTSPSKGRAKARPPAQRATAAEADIFGGIDQTPAKDQLSLIERYVAAASGLMANISNIEEMLGAQRDELHDLTSRLLPDAMRAANMLEFKHANGARAKISEIVAGSLPKDEERRAVAIAWLIEAGAEDLIKDKIEAHFGRDKIEKKSLGRALTALKKARVDFRRVQDVHAQTLAAFARERLKNGEPTPLEALGLYSGIVAKVTPPAHAPEKPSPTKARRT